MPRQRPLDGDLVVRGGRTEIRAIGDTNGDGIEDLFTLYIDDTDGSLEGVLRLGGADGISMARGYYIVSFEGEDDSGGGGVSTG